MADNTKYQLAIRGPEGFSKTFLIETGQLMIIGRHPGVDIQLDDIKISRRHAQLEVSSKELQITDLGSSNGTFINDDQVMEKIPWPLLAGDIVKVGSFEIVVSIVHQEVADSKVREEKPEKEIKTEKPGKDDSEKPSSPKEVAASKKDVEKAKPVKAKPAEKEVSRQDQPPVPPSSSPPGKEDNPPLEPLVPPGLTIDSEKLINYLPGIYHTDFTRRFLGIFESILAPIEWTIGNFDLFLSPKTAPAEFLTWLSGWYALSLDPGWTDDQKRRLLEEAPFIFSWLGTRASLVKILEIYTDSTPEIDDTSTSLPPYTFKVILPKAASSKNRAMIEHIIESNKPAYCNYQLEFK